MNTPEKVSINGSLKSAVYFLTVLTIVLLVGTFFFLASVSVWWSPSEQSPQNTAVAPPILSTSTPIEVSQIAVDESASVLMPTFTAVPPSDTPVEVETATVVSSLPEPVVSREPVKIVPTSAAPFGELIIPEIKVNQGIVPIFIRDGQWDISEIGGQIGHLESTGKYPGDQLAMTFTGHVTLPWPEISGPFADLVFLKHGEEIIYRWNGVDYVYQVERIFRANPESVHLLYEEDGEKLILVTCSGWDANGREYAERLVTRAVLVRQEPSQHNTD